MGEAEVIEDAPILAGVLRSWLDVIRRAAEIQAEAPETTRALIDRNGARTHDEYVATMARWAAFHIHPDRLVLNEALIAGLVAHVEQGPDDLYAAQVAILRDEIAALRQTVSRLLDDDVDVDLR